ncbi:uncharacterized protein LOC132748178 [Ruditapes philippinarum]|uniref:uncharacterized protein LOC132748178 n=1 Tax=Ruditapes philippinarum TaxID=129788 RepID=UPI00295B9E9B|nr:uncharacterized protein LOC132748178 [Ruditapes philippinarum]
MTFMAELQTVFGVIVLDVVLVYGKDCYNYREEPRIRSCDYCCGDEYEQHCCNNTLQIVGCVIGAFFVIGAIIGVGYFCYRNKSKRRLTHAPSALGRFGMRSQQNNVITTQERQIQRRIPRIPGNRDNAGYVPTFSSQTMQLPAYYPPNYVNNMHSIPIAPTAPMPPPYEMTIAPPPYSVSKGVPPPPEYNTVVSHMSKPGHKPGEYSDSMPPPTD